MIRAMWVVLIVQVVTFAALGFYFLAKGETRLGIAQLLLCGVQAVIYSGGFR